MYFHIGLILLLCDAPFYYPITPYAIMRSKRSGWCIGTCLYIAAVSLVYIAFITVCAALVAVPILSLSDSWDGAAADLVYGTSQLIAPDTTLLYTAVSVSDYDTYVQLAYNNYPGMQIVRQQTLLAENDIRLTKANYLPSLSLHAGNTLARPLSTTLADMYNNNWNIGLSLSYNLSSLYQNKHKMHEARQTVQLQKYAEELLMQNVRIQIRTAYTRHKEALNRIEALKLSVSQAEENYRIVQNRYLNQLSILTDLLDASSVRLDAELQLTVARTQAIYTYYELQRTCGML